MALGRRRACRLVRATLRDSVCWSSPPGASGMQVDGDGPPTVRNATLRGGGFGLRAGGMSTADVQNTIARAASGADVWAEFATVNISYSNYATTMVDCDDQRRRRQSDAAAAVPQPQHRRLPSGPLVADARSGHQRGRRRRRAGLRPRRPPRRRAGHRRRRGAGRAAGDHGTRHRDDVDHHAQRHRRCPGTRDHVVLRRQRAGPGATDDDRHAARVGRAEGGEGDAGRADGGHDIHLPATRGQRPRHRNGIRGRP